MKTRQGQFLLFTVLVFQCHIPAHCFPNTASECDSLCDAGYQVPSCQCDIYELRKRGNEELMQRICSARCRRGNGGELCQCSTDHFRGKRMQGSSGSVPEYYNHLYSDPASSSSSSSSSSSGKEHVHQRQVPINQRLPSYYLPGRPDTATGHARHEWVFGDAQSLLQRLGGQPRQRMATGPAKEEVVAASPNDSDDVLPVVLLRDVQGKSGQSYSIRRPATARRLPAKLLPLLDRLLENVSEVGADPADSGSDSPSRRIAFSSKAQNNNFERLERMLDNVQQDG